MTVPFNKVRSIGTIEQHEHEDSASARRVLPVDELGNPINAGNPLPVDVTISGESSPDNPRTARIHAVNANTEYSYALPANTAKIKLRVEQVAKLQYCFENGKSNIEYWTVMPGSYDDINGLNLTGKTIYFTVSKPNVYVQIYTWAY